MPPDQVGPPDCLYHMVNDQAQRQNIAMRHPDVVNRLLAVWRSYRQANQHAATALQLSPEFVKTLRQSGYDFK